MAFFRAFVSPLNICDRKEKCSLFFFCDCLTYRESGPDSYSSAIVFYTKVDYGLCPTSYVVGSGSNTCLFVWGGEKPSDLFPSGSRGGRGELGKGEGLDAWRGGACFQFLERIPPSPRLLLSPYSLIASGL